MALEDDQILLGPHPQKYSLFPASTSGRQNLCPCYQEEPESIVMLATKFVFIAFGAYQVVLASFNYSLPYETM